MTVVPNDELSTKPFLHFLTLSVVAPPRIIVGVYENKIVGVLFYFPPVVLVLKNRVRFPV